MVIAGIIVVFIAVAGWYLSRTSIPILQPRGVVAQKEYNLIMIGLLLSLIVVVPVFAFTIFVGLRYRDSNHKSKKYSPDWDHNRLFESLWWGVPAVIIIILSVITWQSSHALDPYKTLVSSKQTMTIEVIALDWKWLFIYPGQHIASVNLAEFPVNQPVDFRITSDTVMNSFWVPQLGGQIYAMPGMTTHLNLMASKIGDYTGSSANISGRGFAGMAFDAKATSSKTFNDWVVSIKKTSPVLNFGAYKALALPNVVSQPLFYSSPTEGLFSANVDKYMMPATMNMNGAK